jgi:ATP-dependent DNA helicase RecG
LHIRIPRVHVPPRFSRQSHECRIRNGVPIKPLHLSVPPQGHRSIIERPDACGGPAGERQGVGQTTMTILNATITDAQVERILALEENHFADLKALEIAPAKLTRSISAFSNAAGGEVYIGISEVTSGASGEVKVRTWRGFRDTEAANGHLQAFQQLFPLGQYYSYTFLECPGRDGLVLQVNINKTRELTRASDGVVYLRMGAQNLPVDTPEALDRLRLDKGISSFESETLDVPLQLVANSAPIIEFLLDVIPSAEPQPWLEKQQLIRGGKPTVAGVLLFAEEPQALLPKRSGIKIYRYRTAAAEGTRETLAFPPLTIEGHLYRQIKIGVAKTTELVEGIQKLGPRGLEAIKYPPETLHEILTNAVLHRDYSIPVDIHVRIFDNRIEIESPGRLPGHVTVKNILQEQFARNGSIVRLINKFPDPPNKDVGEGLNTAFAAMSGLRLKPPLIEEKESSVCVYIRHEPLASPEESVMEYLETHDEIVNRIGREISGIASENSMKNVFYRLRDRSLIEPVPGRVGFLSAWRKKR